MAKRVRIRGVSVPVRRRRWRNLDGRTFKPTRKHPKLRRVIEVEESLRGVKLLSTLVHEMLHQLDHRLSERTVLQLEEGIVDLVLENPELFDRLWS